jgi:hypothetical protein
VPFTADAMGSGSGSGFGVYKRLICAIPVLWMFVFSMLLLTEETDAAN